MKKITPFRIIAYTISILFSLAIVYPLLYIGVNAMKDSGKIYDVPPSFFPESAKSLSIVMDYTDLKDLTEDELLPMLHQDHILSVMSAVYELPKESLFEIKFYGQMEGKTIYYARAHRTRLDLEKDHGVYRDTAIMQKTLIRNNKVLSAAESLGYEFSLNGLPNQPDTASLGQNKLNPIISEYLASDYELYGTFSGTTLTVDNKLLLESFVHYVKLPGFVYSKNEAIAKYSFATFFFNTAIVLICAVVCQVVLCALTAFPLSRLLPRKTANIMLLFFLGTTMIPFVAVMIPQFTMFKAMGLYNNYGALLLPHLLPYGFFVYLYKGFFDNLPESLFEAAKTDGASNMYLFMNICVPLSKPIISVVALQTFLSNWNDFFWAWMVTERQELWTLNVALYNISKVSSVKPNFIMGLSVITIIPVWLFTIIFSNQIKESIASSGIKG